MRRHLLLKSIGESMLYIRKIQYRMRLGMFGRRHLLLKSMGESMPNIRKIQCRMHLVGVREEATAVKKPGGKYALHTKNTI